MMGARTAFCALITAGLLSPVVLGGQGPEPGHRLRYVTTVRQPGLVAYRDPVGGISPDGERMAYSVGNPSRVYVQPIVGGPISTVSAAGSVAFAFAWLPDSRHLAVREWLTERSIMGWFVYDVATGERATLWANRTRVRGSLEGPGPGAGAPVEAAIAQLQQLTWSPDGRFVAGLVPGRDESELWILDSQGESGRVRRAALAFPAWAPGGGVACLRGTAGHQVIDLSCGVSDALPGAPAAVGPFAFSPDGKQLYYAAPNPRGTLDLWRRALSGGLAERLTTFSRDTYAPSVTRDGRVLFKTQDYRAFVAVAPAIGGPSRAVTSFMAQTPSWDWSGTRLSVTFGDWRRFIDDLRYPDISQDIGIVRVDETTPARAPEAVALATESEDQGMHWSPNGRWLVLHSHVDGSDDLWLRPADGSAPARRLTTNGFETGWPRWSPNGRWIVYATNVREGGAVRTAPHIIGVDQVTGAVTEPQREVRLEGFGRSSGHVEWLPDNERLAFAAQEGPATQGIYVVSRLGGVPRRVHRFSSEQRNSGISVSPDGRWVAFIARAPDGHFQVFRVPLTGGAAEQLTFDPTDKTQPAYSPRSDRIAFTVFSNQVQFWLLVP